jgi:hypothetical protein
MKKTMGKALALAALPLLTLCLCLSESSAVANSWVHFSGSVDSRLPLEADLLFASKRSNAYDIQGSYYWNRDGRPLAISGSLESGRLELKASAASGAADLEVCGKASAGLDSLSGTWRLAKDAKPLPFSLSAAKVGSAQLTMGHLERKEELFKGKKGGPVASFAADYAEVRGNAALARAVDSALYAKDGSGKAWAESRWKEFSSGYAENRSVDQGDSDALSRLNWERRLSVSVTFNARDLLCLQVSDDSIADGSRPHSESFAYYSFRIGSGQALGLKDFLSAEGIRKAPSLIRPKLRALLGMKQGDSYQDFGLGDDMPPLSEFFYVTLEGITFAYNLYELGAAYLGMPEITLAWGELKGLTASGNPLAGSR